MVVFTTNLSLPVKGGSTEKVEVEGKEIERKSKEAKVEGK